MWSSAEWVKKWVECKLSEETHEKTDNAPKLNNIVTQSLTKTVKQLTSIYALHYIKNIGKNNWECNML